MAFVYENRTTCENRASLTELSCSNCLLVAPLFWLGSDGGRPLPAAAAHEVVPLAPAAAAAAGADCCAAPPPPVAPAAEVAAALALCVGPAEFGRVELSPGLIIPWFRAGSFRPK